MPRVSHVDPSTLGDRDAGLAGDVFYNLLAHRPEIMEAWASLDDAYFSSSSVVSNEVKEQARRALAQGVGCAYCASLGTPRPESIDPKESLAVAFAQMVMTDHKQIDDATFAVMRQEFTDAELVELVSWLCFKLGSNMLGALMKLEPATEMQVNRYAALVASDPS